MFTLLIKTYMQTFRKTDVRTERLLTNSHDFMLVQVLYRALRLY